MGRHDDNALIIYTDGSCKPKPRRGGFAFLLLTEDDAGEEKRLEYCFPGSLGSTNNEMELMAPIEALRLATSQHPPVPKDSYSKIVVYADSLLVVNGIGAAESTWPQRGWLTTENEPVLSTDLWQELVRLKRRADRVEFTHVKAHKTNPYNNKVDKLAKAVAELTLVTRRQEKMVTRKTSPRQTEARVVPMKGQTETIRIVAVRAIRGHHTTPTSTRSSEMEARTTTMSTTFAMNDEIAMRRAHTYDVRFADDGHRGRWIEEVVGEIERP